MPCQYHRYTAVKRYPCVACRKLLWRKILRYAAASENDHWKGGGDPADCPSIVKELKDAKKALLSELEETV